MRASRARRGLGFGQPRFGRRRNRGERRGPAEVGRGSLLPHQGVVAQTGEHLAGRQKIGVQVPATPLQLDAGGYRSRWATRPEPGGAAKPQGFDSSTLRHGTVGIWRGHRIVDPARRVRFPSVPPRQHNGRYGSRRPERSAKASGREAARVRVPHLPPHGRAVLHWCQVLVWNASGRSRGLGVRFPPLPPKGRRAARRAALRAHLACPRTWEHARNDIRPQVQPPREAAAPPPAPLKRTRRRARPVPGRIRFDSGRGLQWASST